MSEKRKRAPGGGRKRTGGLQQTGALAKLPPIWVDAETLEYLRSLPNLSEFVRLAINEKRGRTTSEQHPKKSQPNRRNRNPHFRPNQRNKNNPTKREKTAVFLQWDNRNARF